MIISSKLLKAIQENLAAAESWIRPGEDDEQEQEHIARYRAMVSDLSAYEAKDRTIFQVDFSGDGKWMNVYGPGLSMEVDTDDVDEVEVFAATAKMLSILEENWNK